MRLLLTSVGWEENLMIGRRLLKLVGKPANKIRILFVITPIKFFKRNSYIKKSFKAMEVSMKILRKNIIVFQLDRKIKPSELDNIDVVFVFGGNAFDYLDRIRKTGLDKLIKKFVKNNGVYLGLSAGSYLACPTIEMAHWKHADINSAKLKDLKALNFVPFLVTAHFEENLRPIIKESAEKTKYLTIALTDKQAVLVKDNETVIIGPGKKNIFNCKK